MLGKLDAQINWSNLFIHDTVFVVEGVGRPVMQALNAVLSLHEENTTKKPNHMIPMVYP